MSDDIWDGQLLIGDATKPQHEPGPQCQEPNKASEWTGRCAGCDGEFTLRFNWRRFWQGWHIPAHTPADPIHEGCWKCHTPWPGGPAYWETLCNDCAEATDRPAWAQAYDEAT